MIVFDCEYGSIGRFSSFLACDTIMFCLVSRENVGQFSVDLQMKIRFFFLSTSKNDYGTDKKMFIVF